jgi:hypothetical protein
MIIMYIPIAIYKNNAVLIDSMDTFALYYCSSVKQKMRQSVPEGGADYDGDGVPGESEGDEVFGSQSFSHDDDFGGSGMDDDDDL